MGSGRGDRNQIALFVWGMSAAPVLQWGPVVVTGISAELVKRHYHLPAWLQWGPVVVTGIRRTRSTPTPRAAQDGFNGVRSW